MIERTSSSAWVRGVIDMFVAEGLDIGALFAEAGLDPRLLEDPAGRFTIDDVSLLWTLAVQRSGKPTLGLSRERAATYGKLGVVGYAMMACPTLLQALQRLQRYMDVVSNAATFALTEEAQGCWFVLGHLGGERPVPRQRVEFGMLTMLSFCSWITGREFNAAVVEFVDPPSPHAALHEAVFGCPVRYGCAANRALLRWADLALPLPARDAAIAALHERLVEQELERLSGASTSQRVRHYLATRLSQAEPRREQAAVALKLSDRTLQRRLHEEGTSFQQLLDDTRRELAQVYLKRPRNSLKQVAQQLGFEDPSNFFRACKRWFGESPGAYRARYGEPAEFRDPAR
ncbi:AraC family transcriptional regulator [Aquabacterium sp.]|uniref:AraC family transcriptional regulator n=1 Tax=Aquabacterium sp. TaxID=1872578 RepID=UPI003783AC84